jgi:RNA polymerase sigma factor (sigma-70 family)
MMNDAPWTAAIHRLREWARHPTAAASTDAGLLRLYTEVGDPTAFASLVQSHGPMVWAVCRGYLPDASAADDAFQATFLILLRRAAAIRRPEALAGWLHRVAVGVALKARRSARRRASRERQAGRPTTGDPHSDVERRDLRHVLEEELARLPVNYRAPVVLCDREGLTRAEAARRLGWPAGTLDGRLARARALLRRRLLRRGVAPALTGGAVALTVPDGLAESVRRAAAAWAVARPVREAVSAEAVRLADAHAGGLVRWKGTAALVALAALIVGAAGSAGRPRELRSTENTEPIAAAPAAPPAPLDLFGDPLPPGAVARMGTVRFRHGDAVLAVVYSPDGRRLASTDRTGAVVIWEAATGRPLARCPGRPGTLVALAFSPDGRLVAGAGDGEVVPLWDAETGQELRALELSAGGATRNGRVRTRALSLSFAPDGRHLAAARLGHPMHVWEVATGRELGRWADVLGGPPLGVAFTPDGRALVGCGPDNLIRVWDAGSARELRRFPGPDAPALREFALLPDGRGVACVSGSGLGLFDTDTGAMLWRVESPDNIWTVVASPDGRRVVTGGRTGIQFWDATTGRELHPTQGRIRAVANALAVSPDGRAVVGSVVGELALRLWDVASGAERPTLDSAGHRGRVNAVAYLPDGRTLITGGEDGSVRFWEASTGRELRRSGPAVAGSAAERSATGSPIQQGEPPLTDPQGRGSVCSVAVAPDGSGVAVGVYGGGVRLLATATGRETWSRGGLGEGSVALAFAPDGRTLAATGGDQTVRLFEAASGRERRISLNRTWPASSLAFAPDGRRVAAMFGGPKPVELWDVESGEAVRSFTPPPPSSTAVVGAGTLAFSPDGSVLAVLPGSGPISLFDTATGRFLRHVDLPPDDRPVFRTALAFSPDGRTLAASQPTARVRLWEVASGRARGLFAGHPGGACSVAFAPGGRTLATAGSDCTALVWDVLRAAGEPTPPRQPADWDRLWADLGADDATEAFRAVAAVVSVPDRAVPFLADRMRPPPPPTPQRLRELIAALDAPQFSDRQRATTELAALGEHAAAELRQARAEPRPVEVRGRIDRLLADLDRPETAPGGLRALRAAEALERIGTPAAREVLGVWSKEAASPALRRDAQAACRRLDRGPKPSADGNR